MLDLDVLKTEAKAVFDSPRSFDVSVFQRLAVLSNTRVESRNYLIFDHVHQSLRNIKTLSLQSIPNRIKSNTESETTIENGYLGLEATGLDWKFDDALKTFSTAISLGEVNSAQLGKAYAERSFLFFKKALYDECDRDIERALKCKPSVERKKILLERRRTAKELKGKLTDKPIAYCDTVPHSPMFKNKHHPCASSAISCEFNMPYVKIIKAAKNISIGEVLIVEDPFITNLYSSERYLHCHECLKFCYDLIPCPNCIDAMYCEEKCRKKAFQDYHKYECVLFQHGMKTQRLFLRLSLKALKFQEYRKELSTEELPPNRNKYYEFLTCMETYKLCKSAEELFNAIVEPVAFYHFLTTYTNIMEDLKCDDNHTGLKEALVRNSLMVIANATEIVKMQRRETLPLHQINLGSAVYPFYSKLDHSCFPNTMAVFYGSKLVVYALMNITKGDRLTTSRGPNFIVDDYKKRNTFIFSKYYCLCDCIACKNFWLTLPLRLYDGVGVGRVGPLKKELSDYTTSTALTPIDRSKGKELLKQTYKLLNRLHYTTLLREAPSTDYVYIRHYTMIMLQLMGNTIKDQPPQQASSSRQ